MYVCVCAVVSDAQVRASLDAGARTLEEVGAASGAGTDCGSCHEQLRKMIETAWPGGGESAANPPEKE